MKKLELNNKEKLTLYGIVKYPNSTDKQLSEKLNLKHSTITSIKHRLRKNEYFRSIIIPNLQNMGCKMLVTIYTDFSPLIPLDERVEITGRTIEVFDEIFLSVGDQDKGFSLSLSKDYATIGKINDIRTVTFGGRGLLENKYPNMIIFPFEISKVYRFFNFSYLLREFFNLDFKLDKKFSDVEITDVEDISFSETEKSIFFLLIKYPELSDSSIGRELGISRHTVSRLKRRFRTENLIRRVTLPNLKKLRFEILTFFHIRFDPSNPPNIERDEAASLMSNSTIFFATRMFESVMVSIYSNYDSYKNDRTNIMQILKENKWIVENPIINSYSLNSLIFIKDFKFAPITGKILGYDFLI
jgi:DNA-binding MarR family transcriptional regulator